MRSRARQWAEMILAPSPVVMRRIALAGVLASAAIILTGAAVRLSQSGLGCPDWPACTSTSIGAAGATGDNLVHQWIEFGNRLVTVAIFAIAVLVWVAAWRLRDDHTGRRRPDLLWLASAQPAGIVLQAVLGGIVVLTKLNPVWVSVHFVASMAMVAAAVALHVRCQEGTGPARRLVRPELRLLAAGVIGALAVMLTAGTVVTGTGPLAGARFVARYHLPLTGVTQLHADIGWLLTGLVIALVLGLRLSSAPPRAARLGWILLTLIGVQGAVGYTQYFTGLPAGLVWVHVAGSVTIWIAALRLLFSLRDRGVAARPAEPTAQAQEAAPAGQATPAGPAGISGLSGNVPLR
jgi:heme A synthase